MSVIDLIEYSSVEVELTPAQAAGIVAVAGDALGVAPTISGAYRLTASSHVGTIVADSVEVRIRPKVPVDNVLHLLTAELGDGWADRAAVGYADDELLEAVVALLATATTELLRRGPQRTYVGQQGDLDTIRGRIDLTAQFRRTGLLLPIACRFEDFTVDTPANRYLKDALRRASRLPRVWHRTRTQLRHAIASLQDVRDVAPPSDLPARMRFTRLNRAYEPVLRLARLVRHATGFADRRGDVSGSGFLLDMNTVFERFLEVRMRNALAPELLVDGQHTTNLDIEGRVPVRPDLVVRTREGRWSYVADAKYKVTGSGIGRAGDYYQLHAYCTRFSLPEGVLLYATTDEPGIPPRSITTVGDAIRLRTLRVPLQGTRAQIEQTVDRIANDIRSRVLSSVHATSRDRPSQVLHMPTVQRAEGLTKDKR